MTEKVPEKAIEKDPVIESKLLNQKCPAYFEWNEENGNTIIQANLLGPESWGKIFGTNDPELAQDIMIKSICAMGKGSNEKKLNGLAQALADYQPQNAMEAKLCAVAHILFSQGMNFMNQANSQTMMPQESHCMKFAIQCMRLHNETIQALDKLRRGGEQRVVVQHVSVNEGGKAVVGGVFEGGEGVK